MRWLTGLKVVAMACAVFQIGETASIGASQLLILDGFNDATRNKGSDSLDTTWYAVNSQAAGAAPTMIVDNTSPLSGNVLQFSGSSGNSCIIGRFPKVTLAKAGDFIEFSANFRYVPAPTGANTGPTLGLYSSNGTPFAADCFGAVGGGGDDIGYKATKYVAVPSNDFKIFQETNATYFNTYTGTLLQASSSSLSINDTLVHTVKLRIQIAANGTDLIFTAWYDGYAAPAVTVVSAAVLTRTFDEALCMSFGGLNSTGGEVDNLLITTNVATSVMSLQYESTSDLNNWRVVVSGVTGTLSNSNGFLSATLAGKTITSIGAGSQCLVLTAGAPSPTGGSRTWYGGSYLVDPSLSSRVRVRAKIRTENISANDIHITLLEQDGNGVSSWIRGGIDFSNLANQPDNFLRVVPTANWRQYEKTGELLSGTVRLCAYVMLKNNLNTNGKIYMDDFTIEQIPQTGDYLMEAYTANQGNVTTSSSQTLYIYPYDSRGAQNVAITVRDENGATVSQAITPFSANGKFASVNLTQPGYAQVTAQGATSLVTPAVNFTQSVSAALLLAATTSTNSAFGLFSVNTGNALGIAAGSNWNRFFILTCAIYPETDRLNFHWSGQIGNAESAYFAQGDYPYLATNQKWIACLFPIPQSMANVPAGMTWSPDRQYAPTDWAQFKAYIKFIVKGLPAFINYLEVINEPEWNWVGSVADLNLYFKTIRQAVQEAKDEGSAANLKILGPCYAHFYSPTYNDCNKFLEFMKPMYEGNLFFGDTGLLTYVDEISMHAYVGGTEPENDFSDRILKYNDYVRSNFPTLIKPIHLTEFGWQTGNDADFQPAVTESLRMVYTSRSLIICRALGIDSIGLFSLKYGSNLYSLINPDDTPYPSYVSYAVAAKALGNVAAVGPYTGFGDGAGKHAIFQDANGTTSLCLWGKIAGSNVHLPSSVTFTATDFMGRPITTTAGGTLALSTVPYFLKTPSSSGFYYSAITGTITVAPGATIQGLGNGSVDDYMALNASTRFSYDPAHKTMRAPTLTGTYLLVVKSGGEWLAYTILVQ